MHFTVPKNIASPCSQCSRCPKLPPLEEVKLISVGGVKGALDLIIADYTKETGNTVKYTGRLAADCLAEGLQPVKCLSVVVQSAAGPMNDYCQARRTSRAETRVAVARGGNWHGGPAKTLRSPDISTPDAF